MLEILKEKMLGWSRQQAGEFYNNVPRYNPNGDKVWEMTSTGYFLIRADRAEYKDYNGKRYVLTIGDESQNLQMTQQLAELVATKTQAQIEQVTHYEVLEIFAIDCTYSEHQNPVPYRGIPITNTMLVDSTEMPDTVVEATKQYFKEAEKLVLALDELVDSQTAEKYFNRIDTEMFFYDPVNNNWFWSGTFAYNSTRDFALRHTKTRVTSDLKDTISKGFGIPCNIVPELNNYINTECSILQNL